MVGLKSRFIDVFFFSPADIGQVKNNKILVKQIWRKWKTPAAPELYVRYMYSSRLILNTKNYNVVIDSFLPLRVSVHMNWFNLALRPPSLPHPWKYSSIFANISEMNSEWAHHSGNGSIFSNHLLAFAATQIFSSDARTITTVYCTLYPT